METTAQKTKRIIADTLAVKQQILTLDTDLRYDLGADSLDILEVISNLEKEFGITIPDGKMEGMKKVGDLVRFFEQTKPAPFYYRNFQMA
jgi:acyl carrier protein